MSETDARVIVRFDRTVPPYHAGETAAFPAEVAAVYVKKGVATEVQPPAPASKRLSSALA